MKQDYWADVTSLSSMDRAWGRVRSNAGCSGGDGTTVTAFQSNAGFRLAQLRTSLLEGTYVPSALRQMDIPKRKGGVRRLLIPSINDRIVHTAIAQALTPVFEPEFEDASYAYRPGRSVDQAVRAVDRWRKDGYFHVVEADIVGFFDAVRHDLLLRKLDAMLCSLYGAEKITGVIEHWLAHLSQQTGVAGKGLAQGSPLSPLLSNLYLDELDERIAGRGVRLVRFADDFIVLCKKRVAADHVLALVTQVLADHGLELHTDETRITDFDRGFEFLGRLFVRSFILQSVSDPEEDAISVLRDVAQDDREASLHAEAMVAEIAKERAQGYDRGTRVLYLTDRTKTLSLCNLSFSVEDQAGNALLILAHHRVNRIEVGPNVNVDGRVVRHALATDTELIYVNGLGGTEGWLDRPREDYGGLQLAQAAGVLDPEVRIALARRLVDARIRNQRTQLFRLNRRQELPTVTAALARMGRHLRKLPKMETLEQLRGLEGAVGAEYWLALGDLCAHAPDPFRRARPAKDPLNASINYLIGILTRDIRTALQEAKLHPGFGVLHSARDHQMAAVYDLIEPFRAPLTEGLAVYLFNANRLRPDMFSEEEDVLHIHWRGRKALIAGYEQAIAKRVNVTGTKMKLAWRPLMRRQAYDLARGFRQSDPELFQPYLMEA